MVETLGQKLSEKSLSEEATYAEKINARIHHAAEHTHTLVKGLAPIDLERSGLAFALQELAADVDRRRALGEAAQMRALEYTWDKVAQRRYGLIRDALARRQPRRSNSAARTS